MLCFIFLHGMHPCDAGDFHEIARATLGTSMACDALMPSIVHTGPGLEAVAALIRNLADQTQPRVAYGLATRAQSAGTRCAEDQRDDDDSGAPVLLVPAESDLWRQVQEVVLGEDAGAEPRGFRGGGLRIQDRAQGGFLMVWLKSAPGASMPSPPQVVSSTEGGSVKDPQRRFLGRHHPLDQCRGVQNLIDNCKMDRLHRSGPSPSGPNTRGASPPVAKGNTFNNNLIADNKKRKLEQRESC